MIEQQVCCTAPISRAEARRRKLIETARTLFIENGFHATGIAQIAHQSGIAVGQIYRDFSSKEEIVAALVREDCARYTDAAALAAALAAHDADAILAWLNHFVEPDLDRASDRLFAEIVAESSRNDRIAAIFKTLQDDLRAQMVAALASLVPGDLHADDHAIFADAIVTFSLGLLHHRLFRPDLEVEPLAALLRAIISDRIALLSRPDNVVV